MEINNNKKANDPSDTSLSYTDLLPKELWLSIYVYLEERASASFSRTCKKFNDITNIVEADFKAKCKAVVFAGKVDPALRLSFCWSDLFKSDGVPLDVKSHARFYWKTLYKSWLQYIDDIKSTPIQSSAYYVTLINSGDHSRRFSNLRCTDHYNYLYAALKGDYNNGTELAICKLEDGKYYLGLSNRSDYDIYELYSSYEREFEDPDLTNILVRAYKDLSYVFPSMITKELLAIPGIELDFIKYVFIRDFESTTSTQSYSRMQKKLAAMKGRKIKCSEVGCKQSASHTCANVKCSTHCSCPNHKHKTK